MEGYRVQIFWNKWAIQKVDRRGSFEGWIANKEDFSELNNHDPGDATFNSEQEAREHVRSKGFQCVH